MKLRALAVLGVLTAACAPVGDTAGALESDVDVSQVRDGGPDDTAGVSVDAPDSAEVLDGGDSGGARDMGETRDTTEARDTGDSRDVTPDGPLQAGTWCATQWPLETTALVAQATQTLYARAWIEGLTRDPGAHPEVEVEFALGDPSTHPRTWAGWTRGQHNPECDCGNDDEYLAVLTPEQPGEHLWAARVRHRRGPWTYCDRADPGRDGSNDGWDADDAPRVRVQAAAPLQIVTLNLRCLLDDWDARLPAIVDVLAELEPDLVGLQEVCVEPRGRNNLQQLAEALARRTGRAYHTRYARTHWSWDQYDEGVGVLTPHRIETHREYALPGGVFPRKLLAARVVSPRGPVVLGSTHLDHRSTDSRGTQAEAVVSGLDAFGGDLIVLTGDLNETPGGRVTQTLETAGFEDAWRSGEGPGHTFPATRPRARIDYIWLRGDGATVSSAAVLFRGSEASDHLGVGAVIE